MDEDSCAVMYMTREGRLMEHKPGRDPYFIDKKWTDACVRKLSFWLRVKLFFMGIKITIDTDDGVHLTAYYYKGNYYILDMKHDKVSQ